MTTRPISKTYPVATLRTQVTALEAAIAQVLAKPRKEAVHELRKATRQIEAQLELIGSLAARNAKYHAAVRGAKRVTKELGRVRRSAGEVRDLDVQRALTKDTIANEVGSKVRREGKDLRRSLKQERTEAAASLVKTLERHALKLEPQLEELLAQMEPLAGVRLSGPQLEKATLAWYARRRAEVKG